VKVRLTDDIGLEIDEQFDLKLHLKSIVMFDHCSMFEFEIFLNVGDNIDHFSYEEEGTL